MKYFIRTIFLLGLLLITSLCSKGQNAASDSLARGNQLYGDGNFAEAMNTYERIHQSGQESAELYFNLGNAYYKAGYPSKAILNYERAKLLNPKDEDVRYNLEMAQSHVVDKIEPLPELFFVAWRNAVIDMQTVDQWGFQSLLFFVLFLVLFGLFLFAKAGRTRKIAFWFGLVAIVVSAFSFSFASTQKRKLTHRDTAIIMARSVTVKGSPSQTGTELFIIHEGLKVSITDSLGGWIEIRLADGNEGWVTDEVLERI